MRDDTRELTQEYMDYLCGYFERNPELVKAIEFLIEEGCL